MDGRIERFINRVEGYGLGIKCIPGDHCDIRCIYDVDYKIYERIVSVDMINSAIVTPEYIGDEVFRSILEDIGIYYGAKDRNRISNEVVASINSVFDALYEVIESTIASMKAFGKYLTCNNIRRHKAYLRSRANDTSKKRNKHGRVGVYR